MNIVTYKIADLKHPDYNPRQITDKDFKELKRSLTKFDCVEPAVINTHKTRKNIIVGGNQRVRVAEALAWEEFPCVEVSLTLAKEKELNVRLNKNTGGWDWDILANEFEEKDLLEWGFEEGDLKGKNKDNVLDVGEVEFSEELYEAHNYLVLYFDNEIDWQTAIEKFGVKIVKAWDSKEGYSREGKSRLLNGAKAIGLIDD